MKKIIKEVDKKRKIVQVTISDERWYLKASEDEKTGLPIYKGVPSVTWIAGHYPKGIAFYKWLADKGWDEAEAIKTSAGDKGSKVHEAISAIISGEEVKIDSKFMNNSTGLLEELTIEEVDCIKSFVDWKNEVKPEFIAWDITTFSDKLNYAGTVDCVCKIDGQVYIIDFKTSQSVWTEFELQVSAYKNAVIEESTNPESVPLDIDYTNIKLAILQIGYRRNKNLYKFIEIEDCFDLFLNAKAIWQRESGSQEIKVRDYPLILSPKKEIKKNDKKDKNN